MSAATYEWWQGAGFRELRQILYWLWDPINMNDHFPWNESEYDLYARELGSKMLKGDVGQEKIAAYLLTIERDWMSLDGDPAAAEEVARRIVDWRRESEQVWREFGARPPVP